MDPWQRWLVIHAMELLPNGWPRFRQVLVLVARQNGKTELCVILSLFWLWAQQVPMVLGTSTKLDYARISWKKAIQLARRTPELRVNMRVRRENGKEELAAVLDPVDEIEAMYKIAASNEEGGRSLTVDRLVEDEIRQHHDYSAHEAAENTMNAVDDAQAWAISNEGDDRSVVLHDLYDAALHFMKTGEGDYRLGLFAYSAPDGCDLLDIDATAQANPNLGRRIQWENLVGKAQRAKLAGGEVEAKYRTEVLCQRVRSLEPMPIDPEAWDALTVHAELSGTPVFFLDCSPSLRWASIAGAMTTWGGNPYVRLSDHRPGLDWVIPRVQALVAKYPSAKWSYEANGPASVLAEQLATAGARVDEPMSGTDMARACAHLQKLVDDGAVSHDDDDAVTVALESAVKRDIGDPGLWSWGRRKSAGDISPLVAVTGALWLLESKPPTPFFGTYR